MRSWLHPQTLILIFLVSSAPAVAAQMEQPCTAGLVYLGYGDIGPGVKDAPFTATAKTTVEQRLAGGNMVHGTAITHEARDSAGRTHHEMAQGCEFGADGQPHAQLSVNIVDPATKTGIYWPVDNNMPKIAHVMHQAPITPPKPPTPEELAEQEKRRKLIVSQPHQEMKTEKLGLISINGVLAEGTRTTRTVPAGQEGNDLPLAFVNERWRSKELGIDVKVIDDNPRLGKTTWELQDISLGEPDASLFEPPPGYKVEEQHPAVQATAQPN